MSDPGLVVVPLRSDPPWLAAGLLGVALACVGLVMLYFRVLLPAPRPGPALALIPGLCIATFAGALLAWWGRRRGGTLTLEAAPERVVLREPTRREELVDRVVPFGATLLRDRATGRRLLILSQSGDPITLLDASRAAPAPPASWAARTVDLDLSDVAISPSTAHVLTVAVQGTLDPLLGALEGDLSPASPLVSYPLPSGEVLLVQGDGLRLGARAVTYATTTARRITVAGPAGDSQAISLVEGATSLLLARYEAVEGVEGPAPRPDAPDAYLPPLVYELIASRFAIEPAVAALAARV